MAAEKRFTDKPLSVNSTPEIRAKIKQIAQDDHVSENAVARYLWTSPLTLDQLLGETMYDAEGDEETRRHRVPRDA